MEVEEIRDTLTKVQRKDSVVGNEGLSWKSQRPECNGRPHRQIKKPLRYED